MIAAGSARIQKSLKRAAAEFEPHSCAAGQAAKSWLGACLDEYPAHIETQIATSHDHTVIAGYYSMYPQALELHGNDKVVLGLGLLKVFKGKSRQTRSPRWLWPGRQGTARLQNLALGRHCFPTLWRTRWNMAPLPS
jgi:hypothetical protein